jgi:sulfite dehydrogenase
VIQRRTVIKASGALALGASPLQALAQTVTLPFDNGERPIAKYPQKRPMIRLTSRPPQLETPFAVFNENVITPNDAFFVRYHLANIPFDDIDQASYSVVIMGNHEKRD